MNTLGLLRRGAEGQIIRKGDKAMLAMQVFDPAQTELALQIGLVLKEDEIVRFSVDYRKENAKMICDFGCIPCVDECIDSRRDATLFFALEAFCGY